LAVLTVAIDLAFGLGLGLGLKMNESISHLRSPDCNLPAPPPASGSEDEGTTQSDLPSATETPIDNIAQPFQPDIPASPPKTTPLDDLLAGTDTTSWPELVGVPGEQAEEFFAELYGDKYTVRLVEFGYPTTMDV
jgi:hypothetical protein